MQDKPDPGAALLTIEQVAHDTRLSLSKIRHVVAERRELPVVKLGARTLVRREDLDAWIRRSTVQRKHGGASHESRVSESQLGGPVIDQAKSTPRKRTDAT